MVGKMLEQEMYNFLFLLPWVQRERDGNAEVGKISQLQWSDASD